MAQMLPKRPVPAKFLAEAAPIQSTAPAPAENRACHRELRRGASNWNNPLCRTAPR
jgi:hypothetical protein